MKPRSIACVIDGDIFEAVRRGRPTSRNALYDISVVRALRRLGGPVHLVAAVDHSNRTMEDLTRLAPDVVFNLAFSAGARESSFAGGLEMIGIPFTGSGTLGIALANDKIRSRRVLASAGIRVPPFVELAHRRPPSAIDFAPPYLVKPVSLGNSLGIHADSVVGSLAPALKCANRIWRRFRVAAVCEAFIVGREFQVGLVEGRHGRFETTATVELHFAEAAPGRGFKSEAYTRGGKRWRVYDVSLRKARVPRRMLDEMAEIARAAASALGLRGYAKVDMRTDDRDQVFVLEANANPGIWSKLAMWRHPSFEHNLRRIIDAAYRRARE